EAPPTTIAPAPWICTRGRLPGGPREGKREELVRVGEPAHELEAGGREVAFDALGRELRADLGAQLLAGVEMHGQVEVAHERRRLPGGKLPIVPPRKATMRGPTASGRRSRWRSKSPITPCTRRPGYSSVSVSAHSRTMLSVTSTGT